MGPCCARCCRCCPEEPRARLFFLAHAQSSLGTGAGYAGLLLIAYDRYPGAWGITLVLLADFLPATLLGPIFGAAADRWSRRTCAVVADLARAAAFIGIAFVGIDRGDGGARAARRPRRRAVPARDPGRHTRPGRVGARARGACRCTGASARSGRRSARAGRRSAARVTTRRRSCWSTASPSAVGGRAGDAAVRRARRPRRARAPAVAAAEAREGLRATGRLPGVRTLICASSAVLLFAGMLNVVELLFARNELGRRRLRLLRPRGAGRRGHRDRVGARRAAPHAATTSGGATSPACCCSALALLGAGGRAELRDRAARRSLLVGIGNGLVLVYGRVLIQRDRPDALLGRVFGIKDAMLSARSAWRSSPRARWSRCVGTRELLAIAGAGALLVWLIAASCCCARSWTSRAGGAAA